MREQYFEMASGANASCEDRITLVWNGMRTARLNADIEDGVYDGRLGELLQNGRVMFRSERLRGSRARGQFTSSCRSRRRCR
ncbi:NEL-type E3 ubiquitin ligase domain-containing protein [Bradyrhizobium sp. CCBAU 45321]|uniref:NEL-type E3 ubiquitin ligase domain-containing protein n=1 Tax=Bradyrhizobium sp. CCBAU 45321 TaxID=1641878 RepID=UPI00230283F0|nr:NEL-type E3 ubiquitin ligase domain-containing protein [Bradyrhizobium sp. CCBAU 45321]